MTILHEFIPNPVLPIPIAMLSRRLIVSPIPARRPRVPGPPLLFYSAGVSTIVKQPTARCTAAATSNSIISIANIADAFTRATAMQSICTWELTKNMKASAAKKLGFLLDID
jgi:hypothetical protein